MYNVHNCVECGYNIKKSNDLESSNEDLAHTIIHYQATLNNRL